MRELKLLFIICIISASMIPFSNLVYGKIDSVFESMPIPVEVGKKMVGVSIKSTSPVKLSDLRYLKVSHYTYSGNIVVGNIVVHKLISSDTLNIFKELYNIKFPIAKMHLVDRYRADDETSMRDNNTSAFCDRFLSNGKHSWHSYGLAIDINPLYNPCLNVKTGLVEPLTGRKFLDRSLEHSGMVKANGPVYKIFKKYGFVWGGDWKTIKDYQHFEKNIFDKSKRR